MSSEIAKLLSEVSYSNDPKEMADKILKAAELASKEKSKDENPVKK